MSEQEFDIYLSLLGKLLGLKPEQREEISEELRDHLEHRLNDLVAAGHTKQEAARLALEEFGDAAGLANQFVSITRQQRKRWIMRFATFSIAGCFLMALFLFSFWPEGGKVAVVPETVAQNEFSADPFGDGEAVNDDPFSEKAKAAKQNASQKIKKVPAIKDELISEEEKTRAAEAKLSLTFHIEFIELPLSDAMEYLSVAADVAFYIKQSQLDTIGMTADDPVPDMSFTSIRASMALELILHQMDLDYVVRDGIVIVTTAEDVELTHEIRVYDCSDIANVMVNRIQNPNAPKRGGGGEDAMVMEEMMMGMQGGGGMGAQASSQNQAVGLVDLISTTVRPDSWEIMGGAGSINQFQGLIVINNNARAHRDTEKLLEKIRAAKKLAVR